MKVRRVESPTKRAARLLALAACALVPSVAHASGGLVLIPDFEFMLPALILLFVVLVAPINALIIRPLFRVLDERHQKIEGARDRAQVIEEEASAAMTRYRASVREARDEAESSRHAQIQSARSEQSSITQAAKEECDREIAHARSEVAESLDAARVTLRTASEEIARGAAERILGRPLQ